jgi:hypothetical protein
VQFSAYSGSHKDLLRYCLTEGQQGSDKLGYIPLAGDIFAKSLRHKEQIKYNNPGLEIKKSLDTLCQIKEEQ